MMQQLMAANRFISLAPDDPDDSDPDEDTTELLITEKPLDNLSAGSEGTEYYDPLDGDEDTPYFQQGTEPPPREPWEEVAPIDFSNSQEVLQRRQELDDLFVSTKEVETPLGMDTTQQTWNWADVGSRQMPREPLTYPALMVTDSRGNINPAFSRADHRSLFQWINENLAWVPQYDTVYVFVDNRTLSGTHPPDYWPLLVSPMDQKQM